MIVRVLKAFGLFVEQQVIDSNKYGISNSSVTEMIDNNTLEIVNDYQEKIDVVSDELIYIGKTYNGTVLSGSVWTITKITIINGLISKNIFHNKDWDSRGAL